MRAALAVLILSLAACSEPAPPAEAPAPPPEPVMLGGVDLNQPVRVLGTEPFWSVEMTPDALVYSTPEGEGLRSANPGPTVQGTTAVYAAATADGTALVVTLIATECSDGMSDRVYPLTARVEAGNETFNGCAASVAFLNSQPAP
ncbi:MAG: hypothetical protein Q8S03_10505 [Brevundimonas sp.]|uniref:COG3650 family protein n=1 Tax=Brevundimonas sp. TaxID=1871086 RepID=UPI0027372221|nr:hypothetical protein [Brevundimonas sp.]MDP3405111.1 hypothetical protein [Brevundimonas sp.]